MSLFFWAGNLTFSRSWRANIPYNWCESSAIEKKVGKGRHLKILGWTQIRMKLSKKNWKLGIWWPCLCWSNRTPLWASPPSSCDTQHPVCMIPHNNPFHISHDTPSPSTARCGFGVFGLIIHFLTASSNPSPDTSWEHSRHNSLRQQRETLRDYAIKSQYDALTAWCCGDVTVQCLRLHVHILTWPRAAPPMAQGLLVL